MMFHKKVAAFQKVYDFASRFLQSVLTTFKLRSSCAKLRSSCVMIFCPFLLGARPDR